jgi:ATP-dependent helicase/nuclease subunit A
MAKTFNFTPEQEAAINTSKGPILVSAGAGSGKTRVLVERLLRMLGEGGDITEYLIITYTKAAAAELKTRIMEGVNAMLADDPGNASLLRQSHLIHKANIGTIHSFCIGIIRENIHVLDLSPELRVIEESEANVLKDVVLDEIIEKRYEAIEEDEDFCALVDATSAGRDDLRLVEIIRETYEKLQCHPYPEDWMDGQLEKLEKTDPEGDVSDTVWGRIILGNAKKTAEYWKKRLTDMILDAEVHPDFLDAYGDSLRVTLQDIDGFIKAAETCWDAAVSAAEIEFPKAGSAKGCDDYKELRNRCKKELQKLAQDLSSGSYELMRGIENVKPVIRGLFSVVKEFMERYGEEKRSRGVLDFSDQEHMAVKLLTDRETLEPTEIARSISERFREIMVDEYQDVNAVQELIFNAVSRDGKNIFMVGDVKQSIYRFRLADPSIFLDKYERFSEEPEEGEGRKILLTRNFRSKKGVLDGVNFVFSNLMSGDFGEISYTEDEYLKWGGTTSEDDEPCIELDVIDFEKEDDGSPAKDEVEAEYTAKRVLELSKTYKYSDIAVLMRSPKDRSQIYGAALKRLGIPVAAESADDFYTATEITVMASFLSVIDNPRQDVPLISTLRSPIYGFTEDELAEIRMADRDGDFYTALTASAETMEKSAAFLSELERFRDAAANLSSDALIWSIYDRTGFLATAAAMSDGAHRVENLMYLFECAKSYENAGYKGLFSFLNFFRKQMEIGKAPERESKEVTDGVRIMSIHKSKGLEFPAVILTGLARRFNTADTQKRMLIHPKLGVGAKLIDPEQRIEYDTVARRAVSAVIRDEMLAEELRILYVAMTRAKEKLIMTCCFGDCERRMKKLTSDTGLPVEPQVASSASSMADWVLLTALCRGEAGTIRYGSPVLPYEDDSKWDVRLITSEDALAEARGVEPSEEPEDVAQNTSRELRKKLDWTYPYSVTDIPSKLTATELKGRFADSEAAEDADSLSAKEDRIYIREPDFISADERELTGAERGTALHLAMQYIRYESCTTLEEIEKELDRLETLGLLDKKQRRAVKPKKILDFFRSELGRRVLKADRLYREFKFSILVPAKIWYENGGEDEILLQGVIDCCIAEDGGLTIIDYKTDYIDEGNLNEKVEGYRHQLDAYELAMERITGLKVREKVLYFFSKDLKVSL